MVYKKDVGSVDGIFKVTRIGMSQYILLNKNVKKVLDIDDNSLLRVKILKIETKCVKCSKCKYKIAVYVNEDTHDCPMCGHEFLDIDAEQCNDDLDSGIEDRDEGGYRKEVKK